MRTGNVYWLLAAIAVAVVTIALAAFIVILAPANSNAAAASVPQVLEPRVEAAAESHHNRRAIPPVLAVPAPSTGDAIAEAGLLPRDVDMGRRNERRMSAGEVIQLP